MTQYLSPQWFDEMEAAAAAHKPTESAESGDHKEGTVSLREKIVGTPFGDISYVMTIDENGVVISREPDAPADVTFSQDYETAAQLHQGKLTTHDAFFAGRVRVSGHLNTLLEHGDLLKGIAPAFEDVRKNTTY